MNRISWCYGDQNIALLYLQAGYMLSSFLCIHEGKQLVNQMMHRVQYEHTNVNENVSCHGYAGTASMYKAIYYTCHEPPYFEAYKLWINRILQTLNDELESKTTPEIGLLEGLSGIGLTLADYIINDQGTTGLELLIPFSQTRTVN